MKEIGARPWLQMEFFMTPEEWKGLIEFLAAPYDPAKGDTSESKPWAAKRYAQGRQEPWTDVFDKIYFELSNETWNNLFFPWTFEDMTDSATGQRVDRDTAYGLFQEWVIDQWQPSPHWKQAGLDDKFEFVIGGWAGQTDERGYGQRAIAATPRSKHLTIAAYNEGWDEGEGPMQDNDASLQRILLRAPQVGNLAPAPCIASGKTTFSKAAQKDRKGFYLLTSADMRRERGLGSLCLCGSEGLAFVLGSRG